jgi:hypothetical protein
VVRPEEAGIAGGAGEGGERGFAGGVCRVRPADQDLAGAGRADAGQLHQLGLDLGDQARDLAFEIVGFGGEDARSIEDLAHGANRMRPVRWRARLPAGDRARTGPAVSWPGTSSPWACAPSAGPCSADPSAAATASCPTVGCSRNGRPAATGPPTTGCPTCPPTHPWPTSSHLAKSRWRVEHDYRELKTGLGLDHFEGRSWIGCTATSPWPPPNCS